MATGGESALLASFEQNVVSMDSSTVVHYSDSPPISRYNGTWNRLEILGGGSFGVVHLEKHTETKEYRAVKQILSYSGNDMMREIKCMIRVRDHNSLFVGIQCWWRYNDTVFIAMDYYPLGDLTRPHRCFSENETKHIAEQLVQAIFVLHGCWIVHRDIKPKNILIASLSPIRIRIADFGLAVDISHSPHSIKHDTPHYPDCSPDWAAPEQLNYNNRTYTSQVDIWSIGCVEYYLMTLLNPFSDNDADHPTSDISRFTFPFWPRLTRSHFADHDERRLGHFIMVRGISDEANEFLKALINPNPTARLTASEALKHEWINPSRTRRWESALQQGNLSLMQTRFPSAYGSNVYILRVTAARGYIELVRLVLGVFETRPVVDEGNNPVDAALVGAAAGRHAEVVILLLGDVCYRTRQERVDVMCKAYQRALEGGYTTVATLLWPYMLSCAHFPELTDLTTALVNAVAAFGTAESMQLLISHIQPIAVSTFNSYFTTMITAAAKHGNIGNLTTLISLAPLGLELLCIALLAAASSGHLDILKLLLRPHDIIPTRLLPPGTLPGTQDILSSALEAAAAHGHLEIIKYLVTRGIAPTEAAIAATVEHDHTACFQYLVRALRRIYSLSLETLFRYIPPGGIPHCELWLLKQHHNPNSLQGHVPAAARLGRSDVLRWLLANVHEPGAGHAGLVTAAECGHVELVRELSELVDGSVGEAIKAAVGKRNLEVVDVLLRTGRATELDVESALDAGGAMVGVVVRLLMERGRGPHVGPP